jgi:hypothetical protein
MAYAVAGLQPVGGQSKAGNAPQIWSYTSTDAQTVIRASGYFNDASDLLKVNDVIMCASATGGTPVLVWSYVNANASGVVDITDGLVITATDSD